MKYFINSLFLFRIIPGFLSNNIAKEKFNHTKNLLMLQSPISRPHLPLAALSYACLSVLLTTTPDIAVSQTTTWTRCAVEGKTCYLSGTKLVRYGLSGRYVTKTITGSVACTNAVFGDPYPGAGKVCDYAAPPTTISWVHCAAESGTCSFSGTRQVRYGANGIYATRTGTGSLGCNNQVFGDPLPGVAKACHVSSSTTTATPTPIPTPAPTPAPLPTGGVITDSIFAPSSFWYKPIPATVPLHPQSAAFVSEFLRQKNAYYGTVNINTRSYASPVYVADAATPTKTVAYSDCTGKGYVDQSIVAQWASVPIPANARQSAGSDGEMTIYQPSTNTMWEFWRSSNTNGQWKACWGGQMKNVSTSSGIWPNPYGTTATGLPFLGGQITAEELKRGEIRHVIGIALVDLENWNIFSWPATRSDGYNPNRVSNRIPEGTRFRLNPAINVDTLNIHPVAKTIAKAAQKYGFVVWDHAGSLSIRAQDAVSYTSKGLPNPYPALFDNIADYSVLNGFPWDKMQFLPKDYGRY
jgi:hypothetical protein